MERARNFLWTYPKVTATDREQYGSRERNRTILLFGSPELGNTAFLFLLAAPAKSELRQKRVRPESQPIAGLQSGALKLPKLAGEK
jgi:hypothetical protein